MPIFGHEAKGLLKISIQDDSKTAILKLEGKLVGPWVEELNRVWCPLEPLLKKKKLRLDLCGLMFVDKNGIKALRNISHLRKTEILADTPLTRQFAAEAAGKVTQKDGKEN